MKLCEYIANFLKNKNVKNVFGVPGSWIMPLWQELDGILHLCTNEVEASYMATGYGKASKKVGVVITTASPGVTNSISGIASANIDSVPLIHISGSIPIVKRGKGLFQEESKYNRAFLPEELLSPITKKCYHPTNVFEAVFAINEGWYLATNGRYGSVHISLPIDIQNEEVDQYISDFAPKPCFFDNDNTVIDKKDIQQPLIIVGWGAHMSSCGTEIFRLANLWGAPVLSTMKGMSAIDSTDQWYLGCLGFRYFKEINDFILQYKPKNIWVFGSSIGEKDFSSDFFVACLGAQWHVYSNENINLSRHQISGEVCVTNCMKITIQNLCHSEGCCNNKESILLQIRECKKLCKQNLIKKCLPNDIMAMCIKYICNNNSIEQVIVADAGNHYLDALAFIEPNGDGNFYIDVGLAAMGIGISETIGMAYCDSLKKYVVITGDGCTLMDGNSMYNAAIDKLPIIFVVFNNSCLGRVREGQKTMGGYVASDLSGVDFSLYGKALGIKNSYSTYSYDSFVELYRVCMADDLPALIEVKTDKEEIPVLLK